MRQPSQWDQRFFKLAQHIGSWSKDRSSKNGAVVVGPNREIRSTGYNGFPPGVDDNEEERHVRPAKYIFTEHAERNAIYFAANVGVSLEGCTMYATMFPCADCARGIIRCGIKRVVTLPVPEPNGVPGDWRVSCVHARDMFNEAGVMVDSYESF